MFLSSINGQKKSELFLKICELGKIILFCYQEQIHYYASLEIKSIPDPCLQLHG